MPLAHARPPSIRIGDQLALDFLNTLASPHGEPIDWLTDGRDLLGWLEGADMLSREQRRRIEADAAPKTLDAAAAEARSLREWFRGVLDRVKRGGALARADAGRLNALLARGPIYRRIEFSPQGPRILSDQAWRGADELLAPIATAMAELLCEGDLDLVRRCENPQCTLWFYDRTKGHRRRWCSQSACGNRAKVAAFRARKRAALE